MTNDIPVRSSSRRAFIAGSGLAAFALYNTAGRRPRPVVAERGLPPAHSRTWLLAASDELRPPDPGLPSADERAEVLDYQTRRTVATAAMVARWGDGPAVLPWTSLALDLIQIHRPSPVRVARALATVHAALDDTVLAVRDAATAHPRLGPWQVDRQVILLGAAEASESAFPSMQAALAATATAVLSEVFPAEPATGLAALADEAAESRIWAGAAFRSDVEAGRAIGQAVADRAIGRLRRDGADAVWDGAGRPTGPGTWQPTPPGYIQVPLDPLAGSWQPWVLPRGDAYRPPPPPPFGSPAWQAELAAVQETVARRTPAQAAAVETWAAGPGTVTPAGLWIAVARDHLVRDGVETAQAARVLALTSVAMADAFACCWDAKYTYWTARPITADPALAVLIPTPPFPSYTSGHASASTAAATVLAHLFPDDEEAFMAMAGEATQSRLWAGIHFSIDCELGMVGGGMVGRLVVLRAQADEEAGDGGSARPATSVN